MADEFRALVLNEADKGVAASIQQLTDDQLQDGDVTVAISHSTLNKPQSQAPTRQATRLS